MSADALRISRRRGLAAVAALAAGALSRGALAAGRVAAGGRVAFRIPWPLTTLDPHRLDDASAAILGPALFDTLFAIDDAGAVVPSLAESMPEPTGGQLVVRLRRGMTTALGAKLSAREVARSIARSRAMGGRAWLADVPHPRVEDETLTFSMRDPARLARALASPVTAIVPPTFSPERPDGTGPFRALRSGDALVLRRNDIACNGPALLDEAEIRAAPDLAASLSAFESGTDDLGWLGAGLHEPRPGARPFDAGSCAWPILRTGGAAGTWDAPGVAQRICDGVPPSRLSFLALGAPWAAESDEGWGGPPCDLLVADNAPWLVELARALAATISRPAHEVVPKPVPPADLAQRRATRAYTLAIDVTRPLDQSPLGLLVGLASADEMARAEDLVRHPPRLEASPRVLARTLRIGVLGEVRVFGARAPDVGFVTGPGRIEFGLLSRRRRG